MTKIDITNGWKNNDTTWYQKVMKQSDDTTWLHKAKCNEQNYITDWWHKVWHKLMTQSEDTRWWHKDMKYVDDSNWWPKVIKH